MTDESFTFGLSVGLLLGFLAIWIAEKTTDNQADFWRDVYCMDARDPADFCAANENYQKFLILMKDHTND